jgi:hypothetical protein
MTRVVLLDIDILRSAGIWVPGILVGPGTGLFNR